MLLVLGYWERKEGQRTHTTRDSRKRYRFSPLILRIGRRVWGSGRFHFYGDYIDFLVLLPRIRREIGWGRGKGIGKAGRGWTTTTSSR